MKQNTRFLQILSKVTRLNFGQLEIQELKKFLKMGIIFALIIGVYWTLSPLKDSLFIQLVGYAKLPLVKTITVPALIPLVMIYSKILERTPKERLLIVLPAIFGLTILAGGIAMMFFQDSEWLSSQGLAFFTAGSKSFAFVWYIITEAFGSLMLALFWSFASDSSDSESASHGFPLIMAIGQIGGILGPYFIGCLPYKLGLKSDSITAIILSLLVFLIIPFAKNLIDETPSRLLEGFNEKKITPKEKNLKKTGMFEGLKLLLKHRYLLCIFAIGFIFEIFANIFDYNFKINAASQFSGTALTNYLNLYNSGINLASLALLIIGISRLTHKLGIITTLIILPIAAAVSVFAFAGFNILSVLFVLMVGTKSLNYSVNTPAVKRLFIPTSTQVRYKAQSWIETFGSRTSEQIGNCFNTLYGRFQGFFGSDATPYFLYLSIAMTIPLFIIWFKSARFAGKTYQDAIQQKKTVC
jgi:AAA family ATP:ADP antiporter